MNRKKKTCSNKVYLLMSGKSPTLFIQDTLPAITKKLKIKLKKIDTENWRFVLYKSETGDWVGRFIYSPVSYTDLSIFITLTADEKSENQVYRNYLIGLSENIRNNSKEFLIRSAHENKFIIE